MKQLGKIVLKSHSYNGIAFNVTRSFLDTYDSICRIENVMFANCNGTTINDRSVFSYYIIIISDIKICTLKLLCALLSI